MIFFLNAIWRHLWTLGLTFLRKLISTPSENFFGKKLSISLIYSQKEKNWATQKQNSFVGFCFVWNVHGRPIWSNPFSKFENKHITSFLDPFPGSVTHFTSLEGGGIKLYISETLQQYCFLYLNYLNVIYSTSTK